MEEYENPFDLTALGGTDDEISFSSSENYCISVVDIVNSTGLFASVGSPTKVRSILSTFINSIALIVRNFDGIIIKNIGDSLLFYFPETSDSDNKAVFKKVFACYSAILDARPSINTRLYQQGLPPLHYRISADYGQVEVARTTTQKRSDLFGQTVNICTKINPMAHRNGIIIGEDLYRIIRSLRLEKSGHKITGKGHYVTGLKFSYPVYDVTITVRNFSNPFKRMLGHSPDQSAEDNGQEGINIMIVDNEPDILQTFESFLHGTKYQVHTFKDGEEALRRIAIQKPGFYDLIITDIRMAPINGLEFYARVARIAPKTKILFVSALDAGQELVSIFPEVKSQQILRKPVSRDNFIKSVEKFTS